MGELSILTLKNKQCKRIIGTRNIYLQNRTFVALITQLTKQWCPLRVFVLVIQCKAFNKASPYKETNTISIKLYVYIYIQLLRFDITQLCELYIYIYCYHLFEQREHTTSMLTINYNNYNRFISTYFYCEILLHMYKQQRVITNVICNKGRTTSTQIQ